MKWYHIIIILFTITAIIVGIFVYKKVSKLTPQIIIEEKIVPKTITKIVKKIVESKKADLPPPLNVLPSSIDTLKVLPKYFLYGGVRVNAYPKSFTKPEITASAMYRIHEKTRLYAMLGVDVPIDSIKQKSKITIGIVKQF